MSQFFTQFKVQQFWLIFPGQSGCLPNDLETIFTSHSHFTSIILQNVSWSRKHLSRIERIYMFVYLLKYLHTHTHTHAIPCFCYFGLAQTRTYFIKPPQNNSRFERTKLYHFGIYDTRSRVAFSRSRSVVFSVSMGHLKTAAKYAETTLINYY